MTNLTGISKAEKVAEELLKRYEGGYVSRRDGYVIVKYRNEKNETVIAWVRQKPITRQALEFFKKLIKKHEYDRLELIKLYREADYVKFNELDQLFGRNTVSATEENMNTEANVHGQPPTGR